MREQCQFIVLASAVVCGLLLLPAPCDARASTGDRSKAGVERVVPDRAHARDHGIDHYMVQSQSHLTTITPVARSGEQLGRIVVTKRPDEFGLRIEDTTRAVRDWSFRKLSDDRFLVSLQSLTATGEVENSVFHYDTAAAEMLAVEQDGRITTVPEPLACSDPDPRSARPDPRSARAPKPAEVLTPVGAALTDPNLRGYLPEELRGFTAGRDGAVFLASSCVACVTSCGVCLACAAAGCGGAVACAGCAAACVMCMNNCANCYRDYHDEK